MLYVIYVTRLHLYFFCCSLDYITRLLIYRYSIVSGGCLIHFRLCCLHRVIIHPETISKSITWINSYSGKSFLVHPTINSGIHHETQFINRYTTSIINSNINDIPYSDFCIIINISASLQLSMSGYESILHTFVISSTLPICWIK